MKKLFYILAAFCVAILHAQHATTVGSPTANAGNITSGGEGTGNVSSSGTPTSGQVAVWTDSTHIQGSALNSSVLTWLGTPSSSNLRAALTDPTGTGIAVFATDPTFTLTDVTTNNATTSQHGWLPKLGGGTTNFLRADGTWAAPGGSGTVTVVGAGSLTSTAIVTGGGTTTLQTPAATATMDSSGNISTPGSITTGAGGSVAGYVRLGQGTAPSAGTTNITFTAPASVTSYVRVFPGAAGTGFYLGSNSAGVVTDTQVGSTGTGNVVLDTAPQISTIELGNASDTTLARSAAGVISVEGVVIPSISSTNTLTNKRVSARITTITSSATPTINTDNCDCVTITALAAAITSMTTNLTGTPVDFDQLEFRIKDDGTARAITWGASFVAGPTALPTTTTISKALHVFFEWDSVQSKWVCLSAGSDA